MKVRLTADSTCDLSPELLRKYDIALAPLSVIIDGEVFHDGVDVTPDWYMWGEIDDTYARSALGLLGQRHYLTMNLNCDRPGSPYYNLATLRTAADAMIRRGCVKAYTLDGGQTAEIIMMGGPINHVDFGYERAVSDIIYFATAIPEEVRR